MRVWARSLDELFCEAATGLIGVMGVASGPPDRRERVTLRAPDVEALLVDWMSEVLFLFDARGFVTLGAEAAVTTESHGIEGSLDGVSIESFCQRGPAVKAVTYHALDIKPTSAGYEARVYLDV